MAEEIKAINKIVEILDFVETSLDYDEFNAYGDICKIIFDYQQQKIKELRSRV